MRTDPPAEAQSRWVRGLKVLIGDKKALLIAWPAPIRYTSRSYAVEISQVPLCLSKQMTCH